MGETAFNDWRLVALTPLPGWALVLAGLAALAAVALAWRGLAAEGRSARRKVLVALRLGAAALAVLLLLEPGVELLATTRIRGRVAVLVDRSRSMSLPAKANGPTRADEAAAVVGDAAGRAALESRFQVEYDGFAEGLNPADPASLAGQAPTATVEVGAGAPRNPEAPDPSLEHTYLLPALEEAARAGGGRPLAGIVVVTDGADNGTLEEALAQGDDGQHLKEVKERLKALGAPVFTLDATGGQLKDLAIAAVKVDDFAFVRNTVEVEVELAQRGYGELRVPVVLEREGQVVTSQEVAVAEGRPAKVKLSFAPDTTGEFAYTVRVPVQDGEAVAQNNTRSFVLKVIRDRVRVLHVAGRPSWDERFLRLLLKRDPNVDLISFFILRTPSDLTMTASNDELSLIPFPTDEIFRQQLKSFDLVVFHNFTYRPYHMAQYLAGIAEYVKGGGAFLMLGGDNSFGEGAYAGTPIAEVLPVELSTSAVAPLDEPFLARLTPEGRRHPVTELVPGEAANETAWKGLAQLHGLNRTSLKQGAHALLEHPTMNDGAGRPAPVVSVMDVGRGRSMAITADSTWLWSFYGAREGRSQRSYEDFFHHAIRWLVRDPELTQVRVQAEKERFSPNDLVALIVKARSRDYGPAAGARVELELRGTEPGGPTRAAQGVVSAEGTVRLEVGSLPPGPYRASVVARLEGEELGRAEDAFVVEESGPELARPSPRPELLQLVAATTGGLYLPAHGARLGDLPLKDPERIEIGQRKSQPLWDRLWVLALLCAVLGSEWFLRRRWGFF